jgi:Cu/Ag efflux protein CusF
MRTVLRMSLGLAVGLLLAAGVSADEARGRIVRIDADKKEIRLETRLPARGVLDLKIDAKTQIFIGGQPATLKDLAPNRRIRVVFQQRDGKAVAQVVRSLGLLAPPPAERGTGVAERPIAPPKDGEGVAGVLRRISLAENEIVVVGPGPKGEKKETTIGVAEKTAILRDGKRIALSDLKEGETATVKTETNKGKLTATSIQLGQAAALPQPAAPPASEARPRLRQVLKMADELLRELEERRAPPPERP